MRTLHLDLESFDPRVAEPAATEAPLRLIVRGTQWQLDELHRDPESARRRLDELVSFRDRPKNVISLSSYMAQPWAPDQRDGGLVPDVVAAWDRHGRRFSGDLASSVDRIGLLDRAIVLRKGSDGALYYAFIGDGHSRRFGRPWVRRSLGRRHDADGQHDAPYSNWCASYYATAVAGDEPRRHFVDAVIESLDPGAPGVRVNYDRVMLPTALTDGSPALLIVSQVRPGLLPIR